MGVAGSQGTGVFAYSPDHSAVSAVCPGGEGQAVSAESANGVGVLASGGRFAVNAICDNPGGVALRGSGYTAAEFNGPVRLNGWQDVRLYEETPAAPPLYAIRLFARDTGVAGKSELCVRFGTGEVIVIAVQPLGPGVACTAPIQVDAAAVNVAQARCDCAAGR